MTTPHWVGSIAWFDLTTSDITAARAFYESVCRWGHQIFPMDPPYTMFTSADGVPRGGYATLEPGSGAPPHWLSYVHTDDLAALMARCTELGGTVLMEMEAAEVGRWALLRDPQGAVLGAMQGATPPSGPDDEGDGVIAWIELSTADHEAAWSFYEALFGWVLTGSSDMGGMGEYRLFGAREGKSLGGMWTTPPGMPIPPSWLPYVSTRDLDAALARATEAGAAVVNGPMTVPGGDRVVQLRDPQGAMIALHEPAPSAATAPSD